RDWSSDVCSSDLANCIDVDQQLTLDALIFLGHLILCRCRRHHALAPQFVEIYFHRCRWCCLLPPCPGFLSRSGDMVAWRRGWCWRGLWFCLLSTAGILLA